MTSQAQWMRLGFDAARMMMEAQTVMGLRLMGMAGLMPAASGENLRMVTEKQAAFAEAGIEMTRAVMRGAGPASAMEAALRPIGRTTRANSRRLTRRGRS